MRHFWRNKRQGIIQQLTTLLSYYPYIILLFVLQMFPYIGTQKANKKKPQTLGTEEMLREWSDIKKQLQAKSKTALNKSKDIILADYWKVCRLKQIPDFYSEYFLLYLMRVDPEKVQKILDEEIGSIVSESSHYHKIQRAITERNEIIKQFATLLDIVDGFYSMNSGKAASVIARQHISQLLKQTKTLEEIKQIENSQVIHLAEHLIQIRKKTKVLLEAVLQWRSYLHNLCNLASIKRMKIIHPNHNINCLLVPLYDLQFITHSFLAKQYSINPTNNPFLILGKQSRNKSELIDLLSTTLKKDEINYEAQHKLIENQIPKSAEQLKALQILEMEKIRELKNLKEKQKKQKQKEQQRKASQKALQEKKRAKSTRQKQKLKHSDDENNNEHKKEDKNKKRINPSLNIQSILLRNMKKIKKEENKSLEMSDEKKSVEKEENSIIEKSPRKNSNNPNKSAVIMGIYSGTNQKVSKIMNDKKYLEDQLKEAQKKNKQYEILLNKIDKEGEKPKNLMKEEESKIIREETHEDEKPNKPKKRPKVESVYLRRQKSGKKVTQKESENEQVKKLNVQKQALLKSLKNEQKEKLKYEKLLQKSQIQIQEQKQQKNKEINKFQEKMNLLKSKAENNATEKKEVERKNEEYQKIINKLNKEKQFEAFKSQISQNSGFIGDMSLAQRRPSVSRVEGIYMSKKKKNKEGQQIEKKNALTEMKDKSNDKQQSQVYVEVGQEIEPITNKKQGQKEQKSSKKKKPVDSASLVYLNKQKSKKKIEDSVQKSVELKKLENEKQELEKSLKQEKKQKQKTEALLKKSQEQLANQKNKIEKDKDKYEGEIDLLKSKISEISPSKELKKKRKSVAGLYLVTPNKGKETNPNFNIVQSKFHEQKQNRINLQKQIKELVKEKNKLEQVLTNSENKITKEKEANERRIEKYEKVIEDLKKQRSPRKKSANLVEKQGSRKKSESLRMYTTSPAEPKLDASSISKQSKNKKNKSSLSANFFKLPPQIKKLQSKKNLQTSLQSVKEIEEEDKIEKKKKIQNLEIIQTKKTIEIIYENTRRKKKEPKVQVQEKSIVKPDKDSDFQKVKKQKEMMLFRLQREQNRKKAQQKQHLIKLQREEERIRKYQQNLEKQREKKLELERKIKDLKKDLHAQFEDKLRAQKQRFSDEKRQLLARIQYEKEQRLLKEKHLSSQIKFLKQMQANQNELIKILQIEKKNRKQKEQELAQEIAKKQELMMMLEIEEIKNNIETQIRKQLEEEHSEEDSTDNDFQNKKQQLQKQIDAMNDEKNFELEEIDEQNQKLKALIERIKLEEQKLVIAIRENMENDESESLSNFGEQEEEKGEKIQNEKKVDEGEEEKSDIKNVEQIFKSRLKAQEDHEKEMKNFYKNLSHSPTYREKQEVENLIEKYLQNPHQYPPSKDLKISPEEKTNLEKDIINRSRLASDFEKELMSLKKVQSFVPTSEDDMLTSHLLNLKKVYEKQNANALRDELFPSIIRDQKESSQNDLSFESQQTPPPVTIREHVEAHAKKFMTKNKSNKNFLAINKMRLAALEDHRRQKQRELIEQLSKKKARSMKKKKYPKKSKEEEQNQKKEEEIKQENEDKKDVSQKKPVKQQAIKNKEKHKEKSKQKSQDKQKNKGIKYKSDKKQAEQILEKQIHEEKKEVEKQEQERRLQIGKKQEKEKKEQKIEMDKEKEDRDKEREDKEQDESEKSEQQQIINQKQQQAEQKQEGEQKKQVEEEDKDKNKEEDIKTDQIQITNQHSSMDQDKKMLEEDIKSYQDSIRSYISGEQKFDIYQHFVNGPQLQFYLKDLLDISSKEIKGLNNNQSLSKDVNESISTLILIAKDFKSGMEVGIGLFHKQFNQGRYVCDYIIAHNMRNFLNLIFNYSRYIFNLDKIVYRIEYFFDITKLEDEMSIIHFLEFEEKCKRLGEVYIKSDANKLRKYVLRRNLFEENNEKPEDEVEQGKGLGFDLKIRFHSDLMKERGYGWKHEKNIGFVSVNTLVADYIRKDEERLEQFRKNAEEDLDFRELLITTLMFHKKEVDLKNRKIQEITTDQRLQISKKLMSTFGIQDTTHMMELSQFKLMHNLPQTAKRCTFDIDDKEVNYIALFPDDPITKIQSSNSSEIGIFMSLIPKYKILIMEGNEFISMNKVNPEVNVFFYVKHFIKNISDVKKQSHPKLFFPEIHEHHHYFFKELSAKLRGNVFAEEDVKIGWDHPFSNSVIFTPTHKDLVIKKPFIVALMSATLQRAVEGTPICASLIQ